jgi:hypothetical protein
MENINKTEIYALKGKNVEDANKYLLMHYFECFNYGDISETEGVIYYRDVDNNYNIGIYFLWLETGKNSYTGGQITEITIF